jgi:NlpC/P60 family putative phage cell wall peptidase
MAVSAATADQVAAGGQVIATPHPTPDVVRGHLLPQGEKDAHRTAVLTEARRWLGTPYCHQASTLGAGCDCLGLVRGVWRALYGAEPEGVPPYRPDWAELGGGELLLQAFGRWLQPLDLARTQAGDVLVFRMSPQAPARHCAILSAPDRIIHAYWGRACVESWLGRWWRERLVAAFAFPQETMPWPR